MDCSSPGQLKFVFEGGAPDPSKIPAEDIVGVTAVLLTCSYKDSQEFLRVGYYVNVEYPEGSELNENPPSTPQVDKLKRYILDNKPRVTKFQIDWDDMPTSMGSAMNMDENANPNLAAAGNTEGLLEKGTQ